MKNETIAIVGATGKTGMRVLPQLRKLGYLTRPLSRQSEYPFDWLDRATWSPALRGVGSAYITYFPDLAVPQAEDDMGAFVEVARAEGVKHLVLLSGRGEDGAHRSEEVIKTSGLEWNVVRASWFMQNFSESFMLDGLKRGELVLPVPKAEEPFIDVDDIADVVVAALTRTDLRNQLLEITGPDILSFAHCVQSIAKASNCDIGFQTVPVEAYLAAAKDEDLPEDMAWLINELFVHVLDGRNEWTTKTIEHVLGRPARSFQNYVENVASTGVWSSANH